MDDEQVAATASSGGQRRSHAAQRGVLTSALDQHRPDLLNGLTGAPLDLRDVFLVHPEIQSGICRARPTSALMANRLATSPAAWPPIPSATTIT